jgi:hypothetical protein
MEYTTPKIVDYGDVAQLTAAQDFLNLLDDNAKAGQLAGLDNTSGPCPILNNLVNGVCTPIK